MYFAEIENNRTGWILPKMPPGELGLRGNTLVGLSLEYWRKD